MLIYVLGHRKKIFLDMISVWEGTYDVIHNDVPVDA
jgi:hypothetical protein